MMEETKRPRFLALRHFFFHNFWLKVLALVLSLFIYLSLRSGGISVEGNMVQPETVLGHASDKK